MNELIELIQEVRQCGVTLRAEPPDLVITPAGVVPSVRARLKQHKPDILRRLELEQSMRRLESRRINIAVFETGEMRVVMTEREADRVTREGGAIYAPPDMFHYVVTLSPEERRIFHGFKKSFKGGTTEWRKA